MKIVVFSPTSTKFHLVNAKLGLQPLGGADSALLKMIKFLGENHQVNAYIPIDVPATEGNINYLPFLQAYNDSYDADLLILYRKLYALPSNINVKKKIFYSQDTIDTPCFTGHDGEDFRTYLNSFDKIIVLSKFHKIDLNQQLQLPNEKYFILGNAADYQDPDYCKKSEDPEFIYCSTPFRGLVVLARLWNRIISKEFPNAKLHIFSSMMIYGSAVHDAQFDPMYEKLKKMPGVIMHGSRPQKEMLEVMRRCKLLLYPNTYPETYCNVLAEARSCYTPFITTDLGALTETGGKAGVFVEGNPYTEEYQGKFMTVLRSLLADKKQYEELQKHCFPHRTWHEYKQELNEVIENVCKG